MLFISLEVLSLFFPQTIYVSASFPDVMSGKRLGLLFISNASRLSRQKRFKLWNNVCVSGILSTAVPLQSHCVLLCIISHQSAKRVGHYRARHTGTDLIAMQGDKQRSLSLCGYELYKYIPARDFRWRSDIAPLNLQLQAFSSCRSISCFYTGVGAQVNISGCGLFLWSRHVASTGAGHLLAYNGALV